MGTYVYSLRKQSREVNLMGITPVLVAAMDYAYKECHAFEPGKAYKMLVARTSANAERAADALCAKAEELHGTSDIHFYIAWGGFEEGSPVYKCLDRGRVPECVFDTTFGGANTTPRVELVGYLFKVGRRWTIEQECPGHRWETEGMALGDWRIERPRDNFLPARKCMRCGKFELVDPQLRAEYAAHQEEQRLRYAA